MPSVNEKLWKCNKGAPCSVKRGSFHQGRVGCGYQKYKWNYIMPLPLKGRHLTELITQCKKVSFSQQYICHWSQKEPWLGHLQAGSLIWTAVSLWHGTPMLPAGIPPLPLIWTLKTTSLTSKPSLLGLLASNGRHSWSFCLIFYGNFSPKAHP